MAKRAPANEIPYSPLDPELARSVIAGVPEDLREQPLAEPPTEKTREKTAEKTRKARAAVTANNEKLLELPMMKSSFKEEASKTPKRFGREKRVMLSSDEERQIERLVDRLGEDLGTSLKLSHVLRACMTLLCHAEGELHGTATAVGPLTRPANGDAVALAQFEFDLAKLLSKALRDAPPLRT